MSSLKPVTIALAGNPNAGKTTLFNAITGAAQHVGNYPGVTVELASAGVQFRGQELTIVDLPGAYSLTAYTQEEVVTRDFILDHRCDVVVAVIDASNLERNLYLAVQLMELGAPLVLAFNMADLAEIRGLVIDDRLLSQLLGVPIVRTVASKAKGIEPLLEAALRVAESPAQAVAVHRLPDYGKEIEPEIQRLCQMLTAGGGMDVPPLRGVSPVDGGGDGKRQRPTGALSSLNPLHCQKCAGCGNSADIPPGGGAGGPARWLAIKLLEGDAPAMDRAKALLATAESTTQDKGKRPSPFDALAEQAAKARGRIAALFGDSAEVMLADRRYGFISGSCTECVRQSVEARHALSDRIDAVVTNRYLGLPIFGLMMYVVFQLTFWIGNPAVEWLDAGKEWLAHAARSIGGPEMTPLKSLLADGVIGGLGAVLQFVPLIVLLFLAIAVLEDSGYMARAAFVLDRLMHRIGLHGKSFIPMLLGFGCTVPAVMATRTLESRRDRLVTMLVLPLMSCGARLPVYTLIIGAFFAPAVVVRIFGVWEVTSQALAMMGIYAIGVLLAIICIKVLRLTIFRGEVTPFVMELPPYRLPTLRGLALHIRQPVWMYIRKAGTVILLLVMTMWALKTFPQLPDRQKAEFDQQRRAVLDTIRAAQASQPAGAPAATASLDPLGRQLYQIDLDQHRVELEHSAIGRIGRAMSPVFAPCGFDWKVCTALLGAMAAKEVFVGQLGVIYGVGEHEGEPSLTLGQKLSADYTPLQGFCMMLFILIASPCLATFAVTLRESGSWKWAAMQWSYLTVLAWLLTAGVYQLGRWLQGISA